MTESYYTKGEDFKIADAVFDCIGDAGDERFSLNDLTTPGLLQLVRGAGGGAALGLVAWRAPCPECMRIEPPPPLLVMLPLLLQQHQALPCAACCCLHGECPPCLPPVMAAPLSLPRPAHCAGSFWLNPPLPMDEDGNWVNPPARPAEFVDVDPM